MQKPKLFLLSLLFLFAANVKADRLIQVNHELPEYLGLTVDDGELFADQLKGKLVVLTFWHSRCKTCHKLLPVLSQIQKQVGSDKLATIAINHKDNLRTYNRNVRKLKNTPLIFSYDRSGIVAGKLNVEMAPYTLVADVYGRSLYLEQGYTADSVDNIIDALNRELAEM